MLTVQGSIAGALASNAHVCLRVKLHGTLISAIQQPRVWQCHAAVLRHS